MNEKCTLGNSNGVADRAVVVLNSWISFASPESCSCPVKGWAWEMLSPSMMWLCTKVALNTKWRAI